MYAAKEQQLVRPNYSVGSALSSCNVPKNPFSPGARTGSPVIDSFVYELTFSSVALSDIHFPVATWRALWAGVTPKTGVQSSNRRKGISKMVADKEGSAAGARNGSGCVGERRRGAAANAEKSGERFWRDQVLWVTCGRARASAVEVSFRLLLKARLELTSC